MIGLKFIQNINTNIYFTIIDFHGDYFQIQWEDGCVGHTLGLDWTKQDYTICIKSKKKISFQDELKKIMGAK